MESIYKTLLQVRIWHEFDVGVANPSFYDPPLDGPSSPPVPDTTISSEDLPRSYDVGRFFEIVPTQETAELLINHRCLFRMNELGFEVYVEVKELDGNSNEFETVIPFDENLQLSFVASLKDPSFLNYTNLPMEGDQNKIYYASNLVQDPIPIINEGDMSLLFLSKHTTICDGDCDFSTFRIGDIISNPDGQLFEVITLPISEEPDSNQEDQDSWQRIRRNTHFVGRQDAIYRPGNVYDFVGELPLGFDPNEDSIELLEIRDRYAERVRLGYQPFEADGEQIPLELPSASNIEGNTITHRLPLKGIPAGRYTIHFFGEQVEDFYFLDSLQFPKAFFAIELFYVNQTAGTTIPEEYAFIEEQVAVNGRRRFLIRPKTFHLHFKNRLSFWKYYSAQDRETLVYEQLRPLALTRKFTEISVASVLDGNFLPNPSVETITVEKEDPPSLEVKSYTSKIFI